MDFKIAGTEKGIFRRNLRKKQKVSKKLNEEK